MNRNEQVKKYIQQYTHNNPIFVKSLDDNHDLESSMKESLNRIGDSSETTEPEAIDDEDGGDK